MKDFFYRMGSYLKLFLFFLQHKLERRQASKLDDDYGDDDDTALL